jgi:hypothetical protein
MNTKLLWAVVGAIALSAAALVPVTFLGGPSLAAGPACQRVVWIDPQTSVREAAGTVTLTVHTDGVCLVPGAVTVTVTPGSAAPADYWLPSGELHWGVGDASNRTLTAVITNDSSADAPIEDFQVALTAIGADTRVAGAIGQGRILDDDTLALLAAVDDVACLRSDTGTGPSTPVFTTCSQVHGNILPSTVVFNRPAQAGLALIVSTSDATMLGGTNYVPVNQLVPVSEGCPVTHPGPCTAGPTRITVNVRLLAAPLGTTDNYFTVNVAPASSGVFIVDSSARMAILS